MKGARKKERSLNITDKVARLFLLDAEETVRRCWADERKRRGMDGEIVGIARLEIVKRNAKEALIGFFRGKSFRTI